jgi:hypothetical protein
MEDSTPPDISWFDRVKIQAEVLLPVLEAIRTELGTERANELVFGALRGWVKNSFVVMASDIEGSPKDKWQAITEAIEPSYIDDLEVEMLQDNAEGLELNVTRCRFAEYFRSLGEAELGAVLNCECDNHIADLGSSEVMFTRTQTIMSGDEHCDFRYRFTPNETQ